MVAKSDSLIRWRNTQQQILLDEADIIVAICHRQYGKDFVSAGKAVRHAIKTGQPWYIISTTQRQADETFKKCLHFARLYRAAIDKLGQGGARVEDTEPYIEVDPETLLTFRHVGRTLHLPNGGSVTSLPGRNPDTIAGYTGNIILTEFALFPKGGYEHWRVVFPVTTQGYKCMVITTPRGKNTKAYEVAGCPQRQDDGTWKVVPLPRSSIYIIDIYQGVAEGVPLNDPDSGEPRTLEQYREQYGDEIGWRREYELEWTGDLDALIKWAQLVTAGQLAPDAPFDLLRIERDSGWQAGFFAALRDEPGRAEMGWDVARTGDLSSLWVNVAQPHRPRRLRYLVLMHDTSFAMQRTVVCEAMDAKRTNVGRGDATGLGMDSNETLQHKYANRWFGFQFSAPGKRQLGSLLKTSFDDADQAIPDADGEHRLVALDLYAVQREGDSETLKLHESDNPVEPDSHCDIAYSCALAREAASTPMRRHIPAMASKPRGW